MNEMRKVLLVVLMVVACGLAADSTWDGEGGDNLWTTAANWSGDVVPPAGNRIMMSIEDECILSSGSVTPTKLILGAGTTDPGAVMTFSGGSLTNGSYWYVGYGAVSTLNVTSSASVITTRDLSLGANGGKGTVNVSAGTINVTGTTSDCLKVDGLSVVNLSGGSITTNVLTIGSYGLVDISGNGVLTLTGDQTALADTYIADSYIVAEGGALTASYIFNGSDTLIYSPNNTEILMQAYNPTPEDGAFEPDPDVTLSWSAGVNTVSHNLYFGQDNTNLPLLAGGLTVETYDLDELEFGSAYYWRVDEVKADTSVETGDTWMFTTRGTLAIEEFYYDTEPNLLNVWSAGTNTTIGLSVDPEPARDGSAMAIDYDNSLAPYYSEASFTPELTDFTSYNLASFELRYYGLPANSSEDMYVTLSDGVNSATVELDETATLIEDWYFFRIAYSEFTDNNPSLDLTNIQTVTVGVGSKLAPTPGGSGTLYVDNLRLWIARCMETPAADLTGDCKVNIDDLAELAQGWTANGIWPTE